jgi:hypothetical protein
MASLKRLHFGATETSWHVPFFAAVAAAGILAGRPYASSHTHPLKLRRAGSCDSVKINRNRLSHAAFRRLPPVRESIM